MATTVIVDDTDPAIQYGGDWELIGGIVAGSNEYNGTVHASSNGFFTYQFKGTKVFVYGTVDAPVTKGTANATYTLDSFAPTGRNGADLSTITDIQSHIVLYESPALLDGTHTLNVSMSNITNGAPKYYFDFFTIGTTSANATSHVIVDDQDASIKYTGAWVDSHSFNEYLGTDRMAPDAGNANATFTFNGTTISVYGTLAANNDPQTIIDFFVDSGQATRYTAPFTTPIFGRHTLLYSTSSLSQGQHTLLIDTRNSTRWWLDYLIYTPSSASSTPDTSTGVGGSSGGGNSVPTGAIAGGVVGGVLGLAAVAALLFFFIRRWRRKQEVASAMVPESRQFQSTQHTESGTAGTSSRGLLAETLYSPTSPGGSGAGAGPARGMIYGERKGVYQRNPVSPDRATTVVSETIPPSSLVPPESTVTVTPRREVDGGIRLAGSSDHSSDAAPSTLPPVYGKY